MNKKLLSATTIFLTAALLASCNGGGTGTTDTSPDTQDTTVPGMTAGATVGSETSSTTTSDTHTPNTDTSTSETTPSDIPVEPEAPTLPADAIDVTTAWGVRSGEGHALENSVALYRGVNAMPDGSTVYFPEGTYEVAFSMLLFGRKDIRIVGHKATLVRTGTVNTTPTLPLAETDALPPEHLALTSATTFIYAAGTTGLTIEGLTFAYDTPTSLSGKVVSVSGTSAVIELTDGSPVTGGEYATVINTFTEDGRPDRTLEQYAETNFPIEKVDEKTIRISNLDPGGATNLRQGIRVCVRLCSSREYIIIGQSAKDLTFRNLTFRNSYNGGIMLADRCSDVLLDGVRVQSENPEALMSLNADILHILDMTGKLTVQNCFFDRPGDDCVNVHTTALSVESVSGSTAVLTSPRFGDAFTWAAVGDTFAFYDPTTFRLVAEATVAAVEGKNITFQSALPAEVTTACLASNQTTRPTVEIRNTVAQNTRARGFLLQTKEATVESCHIRNTALAAILVAPDVVYWYEMSPVEHLTIRDNLIENCGQYGAGAIQITAAHDKHQQTYPTYIHKNISIHNNQFKSLHTPAVYAVCVSGLTVTGNTVSDAATKTLIALKRCEKIILDKYFSDNADTEDIQDLTIAD